jgi:hypothetical protein
LAKPPVEHATKLLSELQDLFRKTLAYTEEDDGRRRSLAITLFANVLNVFVELSMWEGSDYGIFGAELRGRYRMEGVAIYPAGTRSE